MSGCHRDTSLRLNDSGMSGTDAARRILADRDLPLIFLSSHTEPEIVEKTEGITSYGYIVKNSGDTVLLASIRMAFRLHTEKRARMETEARNRAIFENLPLGLCYYDSNGVCIDCNQAMADTAGVERSALIGFDMTTMEDENGRLSSGGPWRERKCSLRAKSGSARIQSRGGSSLTRFRSPAPTGRCSLSELLRIIPGATSLRRNCDNPGSVCGSSPRTCWTRCRSSTLRAPPVCD
jgi:PAS domain S-box-containing protein